MVPTILYALYCVVFPLFLDEHAEPQGEPHAESPLDAISEILNQHVNRLPLAALIVAKLRTDYWHPIVHPIMWWRHMNAVNQLLESVGWIDLDF